MSGSGAWIRSRPAVVLLWVAFALSLVCAVAFVVVSHRPAEMPVTDPMTDARASAQVVDSAKAIVGAARLQRATGGYSFVSCTNATDPPYQVTMYMRFLIPQHDSAQYLDDVAAAMVTDGWMNAPTSGDHLGQKLTHDGVTSVFYPSLDNAGFATMRLYGECRTTADHRHDNPVWTEVSL